MPNLICIFKMSKKTDIRDIYLKIYILLIIMVLYTCPRCGFSNKIKTKVRSHLLRKNPCVAKLCNISIEKAYWDVLGENIPNINIP